MMEDNLKLFKKIRYYKPQQIENIVVSLLSEIDKVYKNKINFPVDPCRIADFLNLFIVWDKIPPVNQAKISARIFPLQRLIEINEDIIDYPEGFEASTIAHEIGHWMLHINHEQVDQFLKLKELGIELQDKPFLCRNINEQKGIEWQAQYFASCLLMPKHILEEKRQKYDLTNWKDLYKMKDEFGVTISNLRHRLISLKWIVHDPNSKQIYLGEAAPSRKNE